MWVVMAAAAVLLVLELLVVVVVVVVVGRVIVFGSVSALAEAVCVEVGEGGGGRGGGRSGRLAELFPQPRGDSAHGRGGGLERRNVHEIRFQGGRARRVGA